MSRVSLEEAKAGFEAIIARVEAGEVIVITTDGVPVAELSPITSSAGQVAQP